MGVLRCSIIYLVNMQYNIKGFAAGSLLKGSARERQYKLKKKKVVIYDTEILSTSKPSCDSASVIFKDITPF